RAGIDVGAADRRPGLAERHRDGAPDTRARPGHQRAFALQRICIEHRHGMTSLGCPWQPITSALTAAARTEAPVGRFFMAFLPRPPAAALVSLCALHDVHGVSLASARRRTMSQPHMHRCAAKLRNAISQAPAATAELVSAALDLMAARRPVPY